MSNPLSSLFEVYNNPTFSEFGKPCDSNLKTEDGTEFNVYSEFLSGKSEFFRALFSFDKTFGQTSIIHGVSSNILEVILIYLYTGLVSLNSGNVMHLLRAADFLLIEPLKSECRKFLSASKTVKNCIRLFLTAYQMKEADLQDQCQRFLVLCFEKAVKYANGRAWDLPYESLETFLRYKSINVSGERFIWSLIEAWVQKDPLNRMLKVPDLLRCLSFNEVDEELASDIISSPIVQENVLCKLSKDPTTQHSNDSKRSQIMACCSGVPYITGFRFPPCLYFVTKGSPQRWAADMFISYDENLDVWRKLGRTSKPRKIIRIGTKVYMFKSSRNGDILKKGGSVYDLLNGKITRMAPIPPPVPFIFFYVEAGGSIYSLKRLNGGIVEEYLEDTDRWVSITPMHPMVITGAVGLNGMIYVIGNIMEERMVMQVYDPSFNSWFVASSPNVLRDFASAVVFQGKIFLIGGLSDGNTGVILEGRRDVEVYDPLLDEWSTYPDLPFDHSSFCTDVSVVQDRLYVFKRRVHVRDVREKQPLVAYWDGCGGWKVADDNASLLHMCVCPIEDYYLVREVVKKNRASYTTKWKETGLEKVIPLKSCDEVLF